MRHRVTRFVCRASERLIGTFSVAKDKALYIESIQTSAPWYWIVDASSFCRDGVQTPKFWNHMSVRVLRNSRLKKIGIGAHLCRQRTALGIAILRFPDDIPLQKCGGAVWYVAIPKCNFDRISAALKLTAQCAHCRTLRSAQRSQIHRFGG